MYRLYRELKYFFSRFDWMRIYFSPFKKPKINFYIGKIAVGVPYFYPRRFVRLSKVEAELEALREYDRWTKKGSKRDLDYWLHLVKNSRYPKDKLIGFDFVGLRWKTKWDSYRHEANPVWSFVFFKWQVALVFQPEHDMHYWECWLNYIYETDKTKTVKDRVQKARKEYPCVWISGTGDKEVRTCYWNLILKKKYL